MTVYVQKISTRPNTPLHIGWDGHLPLKVERMACFLLTLTGDRPYKIHTICQWDGLSTNGNGVRFSLMEMGCPALPYPCNMLTVSF